VGREQIGFHVAVATLKQFRPRAVWAVLAFELSDVFGAYADSAMRQRAWREY
jgi:hypothetical protein